MENLTFFDGDLKVTYRSEGINLLPKEYQLMKFLYHHPLRVFTRDELLEAVWPMDTPTDRTVDDHIYRIRKKLAALSSGIEIKTIRGQGYQLKPNQTAYKSPLLEDKEVSSNVKILFHKYHLYGQGDALKLLEQNQDVFGFELDWESRLYLDFMGGEFWNLVRLETGSFWHRCFYILHIYIFVEEDKQKCLHYFTCALSAKELPEMYRLEIRLLSRLQSLLFTKRLDEAEELFHQSKTEILERHLEGFIPTIYLTEIYLEMLKGNANAVNQKLSDMEAMLIQYPFSREKATFLVLKGIRNNIFKIQSSGDANYIDQGLKLFQEAKFIPGILNSLLILQFFLKEFQVGNDVLSHYQKLWNQYAEKYNFKELKKQIKGQLEFYLKHS